MEKNVQPEPSMTSFFAASLAPALVFALANALFLPYVLAMTNFGDPLLMKLIPRNIPGSGYLIMAVLVLLAPLLAALVLLGPALTSWIVNLIHPIFTNWSKAFLGGMVFFVSHLIFLIILLFVRNEPLFPKPDPVYPILPPGIVPVINFPIDPLAIAGLLSGFVLSGSVILFGWLGARRGIKRS